MWSFGNDFARNVVIFHVDNISSSHTYNKKKLVLNKLNKSKKLTKHISSKCECKFDSKKCNSNEMWNNNKCWCECKN